MTVPTGKSLVNVTPHMLHVYDKAGKHLLVSLPSAGAARVSESQPTPVDELSDIPVEEFHFSEGITGLPEPQDGTVYVVSLLTAVALIAAGVDREDIRVPGPEIRDEQGRITGCRGLRRLTSKAPRGVGWTAVETLVDEHGVLKARRMASTEPASRQRARDWVAARIHTTVDGTDHKSRKRRRDLLGWLTSRNSDLLEALWGGADGLRWSIYPYAIAEGPDHATATLLSGEATQRESTGQGTYITKIEVTEDTVALPAV